MMYESSVTIKASKEKIWNELSQVSTWALWIPTVSDIKPLDGEELALGRRFLVSQPKLKPTKWTVNKLEPYERFDWVAKMLGLKMVAEHIIIEESPSRCTVVLRFGFEGIFAKFAVKSYGELTQNYINQESLAIKKKVGG
ncbi:MAG: hypothetical protein KU37_07360 [Sulfuricurvum sp. PC08-66]|nr:MAG: hypothetical protein KU37_07360 [Sulfuricurvum sp. PC08-66]